MSKAPETIYLQTCDGEFHDDVTWCADHINDTDTAYVRGDIAYGYASQVERLEKRLEVFGTNGNGDRVRLPESCDGIACRDETIRNLQRILGAAHQRVARYESMLRHLSRNASVMTAHQIETMARDALTKEG